MAYINVCDFCGDEIERPGLYVDLDGSEFGIKHKGSTHIVEIKIHRHYVEKGKIDWHGIRVDACGSCIRKSLVFVQNKLYLEDGK